MQISDAGHSGKVRVAGTKCGLCTFNIKRRELRAVILPVALLLLLLAVRRSWRRQRAWAAARLGIGYVKYITNRLGSLHARLRLEREPAFCALAFVSPCWSDVLLLLLLLCACACSSSTKVVILLLWSGLQTWPRACQQMSPAPMGLHEKGGGEMDMRGRMPPCRRAPRAGRSVTALLRNKYCYCSLRYGYVSLS